MLDILKETNSLLSQDIMKNKVAVLWDSEIQEWGSEKPLGDKACTTYEFFSKLAQKRNIQLLIANYKEYENGVVKKSWAWEAGSWERRENEEVNLVFDKFKLDDETFRLKKRMAEEVGIINAPELDMLCKDKLKSYKEFSDLTPRTMKATRDNVKEMIDQYGKVVIKPRYAFGGKGVTMLETIEEYEEDINPEEYVVQRFVDSSKGIEDLVEGSHDLRAIISNGEVQIAYVRFNEDDFISNVAEGGNKKKVDLENFPDEGKELVEKVKNKIDSEFPLSNYSVDLFFDEESNPWIIELNSKPGMNFKIKGKVDQELKKDSEKLMKALLDMFAEKID